MSSLDTFRIRSTGWVRPLLVLFTATESRSTVEIAATGLHARFGWYRIEIAYDAITSVQRASWPWYAGIGWRTNFRTVLGLIGSYDGVVEIVVDPPVRTRLLAIPVQVQRFYVSLEEPDRFIQALEQSRSRLR